MTTALDVTLSSTLLDELKTNGTGFSAVYVVAFDAASTAAVNLAGSSDWATLAIDGTVTGGTPVNIDSSLTGTAADTISLPGSFASGKIYVIVESSATNESLSNIITLQSQINAQSATQYNFGYDSIEANLTGTAYDAGNLTSVVEYGLPMALGVSYSNGSTASSGYNVSGASIVSGLTSAGSSISTYSSGPLNGTFQMAVPPSAPSDWVNYVSSLEGTQSSGITLSGFFDGAADSGGTYHNAGYYAYDLVWDTASNLFLLEPLSSSEIKGTIALTPQQLENSIYETNGTADIYASISTTLVNGQTTITSVPFETMNTGANNQWGAVLRELLVGFNAGYFGSTGQPINAQLGGTTLANSTIDLNQSYNWDPAEAFGQSLVAHPTVSQYYNSYAAVIGDNSNSYGYGYSDAQTAAYTSGGPLISLAEPGTSTDVPALSLTIFGPNDQPTGYTTPAINNIITPPSGTYAIPAGLSSDNIVLDFAASDGTNAGVVLSANSTIELGIMTSDTGGHPSFTVVTLQSDTGPGLWQNWAIETLAGGGYTAAAAGGAEPVGAMQIQNLPLNASGGVTWFQVTEANSGGAKTFDLYMTAASPTTSNTGTISQGSVIGGTISSAAGTLTANGGTITGVTISGADVSNGTLLGGTITSGTLAGATVTNITLSSGIVMGGTLQGASDTDTAVSASELSGGVLNDGTLSAGTVTTGTITDGIVGGFTASGSSSWLITGGTTETSGLIVNATLTAGGISGGTISNGIVAANGANSPNILGETITGGTISAPVQLLNPNYGGQSNAAAVDGLGGVSGTSGQQPPQYVNSLTYNLAGSDATASNPALLTINSSASLVDGLAIPFSPVVGTIATGGTFIALGNQAGTSGNVVTTTDEVLNFAWTGENRTLTTTVQNGVTTTNGINVYSNKVNAGDVARIEISSSSYSTFTTAAGNLDGAWQTGTVDLQAGTYSVTMQDFLASDTSYANPLTPLSDPLTLIVQSGGGTGVPATCFAAGTRIAALRGGAVCQVPVQALAEGDEVVTASGTQKLLYLGHQAYDGRFIAGNKLALPICIKAGALGENLPMADLYVSPGHAFAFGDVLIQARHLVNGLNITQAEAVECVHYYHLGLAKHDLVFAEGAPAESLFPNDEASEFGMGAAFAARAGADLPQAMCLPLRHCGHEVEAARQAIIRRAPGLLLGYVDEIAVEGRGEGRVAIIGGWAQNQADWQAETPPVLEIYAHGRKLGETMPNMLRHDLCHLYEHGSRHSYPTSGRHAFRCEISVAPAVRAQDITVRGLNGQELCLSHDAAAALAVPVPDLRLSA